MMTRTNGPRSKFERRHYRALADVIRRTRQLPHDSCAEAWGDLIETLCDHFASDNPNFQRGTFKRWTDPARQASQ